MRYNEKITIIGFAISLYAKCACTEYIGFPTIDEKG